MQVEEALAKLQSLKSEQTQKVLRRHGAGDNVYGVRSADLERLRRRIKVDQALAEGLWQSGNTDARTLATMVADPARITSKVIDGWMKDVAFLRYPMLLDLFVRNVVSKSPLAQEKLATWLDSIDEWTARAGWVLLAALANAAPAQRNDAEFDVYLARIERDIHTAKNRTKEAMNATLIAIGIRSEGMATKATAVAKRIGKVEIEHGETSCKTPDAVAYIAKARARKEA